MTLPDTDLAALEEMEKKATPGPWRVEIEPMGANFRILIKWASGSIASLYRSMKQEADSAFIAALRTAAPALVAEVKRLTSWVSDLEQEYGETVKGYKERFDIVNGQRFHALDRIATLEAERDRLVNDVRTLRRKYGELP